MSIAREVTPLPNTPINKRVVLRMLFAVYYGRLQGDPGAEGNPPRIDPDTRQSFCTVQGMTHKVRNALEQRGHEVWIRHRAHLDEKLDAAIDTMTLDLKEAVKPAKKATKKATKKDGTKGGEAEGDEKVVTLKAALKNDSEARAAVVRNICQKNFDVRAFGGFFGDPLNDRVVGAVHFTMPLTVDPVEVFDMQVAPVAAIGQDRTLGTNSVIPFGLYRCDIKVDPANAAKNGFTWADYDLLIECVKDMFECSVSSTRPDIRIHHLVEFQYDSALGGPEPLHKTLDRLKAERMAKTLTNGDDGTDRYPRSMDDYKVTLDRDVPQGITIREII